MLGTGQYTQPSTPKSHKFRILTSCPSVGALRDCACGLLARHPCVTQFEPARRSSHTQGCKTQITWVDQQCNAPVPDPVSASENQERNVKTWLQFPRAQPGRLLFPEALERGIPEPPCPVLPVLAHSPGLPQTPPLPLHFPPSGHLCPPFRTAAEMGLRPAAPLFSSLPAYQRAMQVWSATLLWAEPRLRMLPPRSSPGRRP